MAEAESFGDAVARSMSLSVSLYSLSLSARGTGAVGEMTSLLSAAFGEVKQAAKRGMGRGGKHRSGIVLLIDEADALAQSRGSGDGGHTDRDCRRSRVAPEWRAPATRAKSGGRGNSPVRKHSDDFSGR